MTGYAFKHGATAYTPDGPRMTAEEADAHNAALEAAEVAHWGTAPDTFNGYISRGDLVTWRGVILGRVVDTRIGVRRWSTFGPWAMHAVRIRGNNGATYHGRYNPDRGEFIRIRKAKADR